ncbi:MAG TPA: hypothetical protein VFY56_10870 [Propionibacteriaceae bacterium]|nr:hypothetical protein [Propionibacteriaceae bacterium]
MSRLTNLRPGESSSLRRSSQTFSDFGSCDEELAADIGPLEVTGSYISHLMCWRDLDVMLLVGADYGPQDVLRLISQIMELPGVVGFDYRDERADRSPTGEVSDERYHVPILLERAAGIWRLDLSLWLHDIHDNVTAWHQELRNKITDEQRAAVLRIKDVWFRLPSYPMGSVASRSIPL